MITVKLSYTIMDTWARGQWEQAVGMYLGKSIPETPQLQLGRVKHEIWGNHIFDTRTMPEELGEFELTKPVVEQKYEKMIPFSDKVQILLRGKPDCTDGTRIYEFKTGLTSVATHVDTLQCDYYKILLPEITEAIYLVWNPYTKKTSLGVKYLSTHNAQRALNHLITNAGAMINYLQMESLLRDYKPKEEASNARKG